MAAGSPLKPPPAKKQKQSMLPKFVLPPSMAPTKAAATSSGGGIGIGIGSGMEDGWSDSGGSQPVNPSPSLLTGTVVSMATGGGGGGEGTAVIQTVNLSSKLRKDSTSTLKGGVEGKPHGEDEALQQVPKEPPTLPSNLPSVLFSKVVILEQV